MCELIHMNLDSTTPKNITIKHCNYDTKLYVNKELRMNFLFQDVDNFS